MTGFKFHQFYFSLYKLGRGFVSPNLNFHGYNMRHNIWPLGDLERLIFKMNTDEVHKHTVWKILSIW